MLDVFRAWLRGLEKRYCNFVYNKERKAMKRILSLLLFAACLAAVPVFSFADVEEGDVIDIQYLPSGQSLHRSMVPIPLQAIFYPIRGIVTVEFAYDLGEVGVRMTNCTAGLSTTTNVDSMEGTVSLPVPFGCGLYLIEFLTPAGDTFYGYFTVQ